MALAFVLGLVFSDAATAWSAALGVAVALANFAVAAELLAWAAGVSLAMVQWSSCSGSSSASGSSWA